MNDDIDELLEVTRQLSDFLDQPRDGKDGKDGRDGRDGVDGKDGERGPKGDPGINGRDGRDGLSAAPSKPGSFRFSIVRDQNGLMVEVVARPIEESRNAGASA